jgi:uncharacterized protein (DUF488 family)
MATLYTIGHGARSAAELISMLREAAIESLVDVRAFPVSKRNPQFAREPLAAALEDAGIRYDWQGKALGGYRKVPYAEHMKTVLFRDRSSIAQWLVGRGHRVVHLLAAGRSREHVLHFQEELWRDD